MTTTAAELAFINHSEDFPSVETRSYLTNLPGADSRGANERRE
jgi:hypothetical protein